MRLKVVNNLLLLLGASILGGPGWSASAETLPPPVTIVGYDNLWHMIGEQRDQPQHFQIDAIIHFYDPNWRLLWARDGDAHFFFVPPGKPLPIRAGQLVRLTGVTTPSEISKVASLSAEVMADNALPPALPTLGKLGEYTSFDERWVEIEGYVDSQIQVDTNHLRLIVVAEGLKIECVLLVPADQSPPTYQGSIIRAQGVYGSRLDPERRLQAIDLRIPDSRFVSVCSQLRTDPRFEKPAVTIEQLPELEEGSTAKIAGRITATNPGNSITVRDATGQVDVFTPQQEDLKTGMDVEAIGVPKVVSGQWVLRQGLLRNNEQSATREASANSIRLAEHILALPPALAAAGKSVRVRGVVTWISPGEHSAFVQDPSGGVRVNWSDDTIDAPTLGAGVTVLGVSAMGSFAPTVTATRIIPGGLMGQPEPRKITLEQAETGIDECRWVEMEGMLHSVQMEADSCRLRLTTPTGDFTAIVPADRRFAEIRGAFVRLRGVCTAIANAKRQLTAIQLWVPTASSVEVAEAPPSDLFNRPHNPITSLRQFGPLQRSTRWLRTGGSVVYSNSRHFLVIQDESEGLTVLPANNTNTFEIGEQLIVVGVPGRDKSRMVLRNASVRSIGHNQSPSPVGLSPDMTSDERLDCRLVHLSGTLSRMSSIGMDQLLEISWGDTPVVARLMGTATMKMPESWKTGSMVEITGIFRSVFDENRRRTGFEVLLRNIDDVAILRSPPWWTTERALGMAGGLAVFGAFAFLWVVFLRRRVAQQTSLIREQMVKETKLEGELERAQRLHALGTLAGGIAHDFNNLLTVVMGNITLAMLDSKVVELAGDTLREAETGTKRARDLTQQMLTFARGGDPVREHVQLRAIIEESVQFALSGTNVVADIQVPDDLWTAHADRSQLHSALTSLLQHARSSMPEGGAVSVESSNEAIDENDDRPLHPGRYVKIRIKDQGTPIPANRLSSIFDPYASVFTDGDRFGLASAYSIARKHGGLLAVEPGQERGTIFTLWIPSSTDAKPAENPTEPAADIPEFTPIAGSRVLFMDDEESIRRLAETVLGQLQCHCVTVADGSDCLRTYRVAKEQGQPFDLVILDLTVPGGMGGADTVKELRKFAPEAVAVVSSGYANDPILAHYQEYGFSGVVAKPYAVERFRDVVREILAKQRSTSA